MRARDIMSSPAVTVHPDAPIDHAARTLTDRGYSALPVVDDDHVLVGIVTENDLTVLIAGSREPRPGRSVAEVMTTSVISLPAATDVAQLATTMLNLHLRSVPIMDGRRVVGIVTRRDLVHTLARDETSVAREVRNRLERYGGRGRWTVSVSNGVASIGDAGDDVTDRHVATVLALAVPGVTRAEIVSRNSV